MGQLGALVPFNAADDTEIHEIGITGSPYAYGTLVLRGNLKATGEPFRSVIFERPTEWPGLAHADQHEREEAQVYRFLDDYLQQTGTPFATEYARGDDPPDFVLTTSHNQAFGLECTQIVYSDRLHAWNAIQNHKRALLGVDRNRFRHLRGYLLRIAADGNALPPGGRRGTRELTNALTEFRPSPGQFPSPPADLSGSDVVQRFGPYALSAEPLTSSHPATPFLRRAGFELLLSLQTDVRASEAWSILTQRVSEKDRSGSDGILVSCGAPVVRGLSFYSDEVASEVILATADEQALPATSHVKVVYLHTWSSSQIVRLTPAVQGAVVVGTN
jgi:hypothetical protein